MSLKFLLKQGYSKEEVHAIIKLLLKYHQEYQLLYKEEKRKNHY